MAESEPRAHLKEEAVSQPSLHKTPKQAQGQGVIDPQPQPMQFASSAPDNAEESESQEKKGRRKISIQFIENKSRRHITFSKRKAGIMKKAYELATLTGTQVLLLVASETGHVYTFATPKLQPLITNPDGKNLIQACLNAPDGAPPEVQNPPSPKVPAPQQYATPVEDQRKYTPMSQAAHSHSTQQAYDQAPMYLPEEHYKMQQHRGMPHFPPGVVPPNFQYGPPFPPSFHPGMQPGQQHPMRPMTMPSQYHPQQGDYYPQAVQTQRQIHQQREESEQDEEEQ